MPVTSPAAGVTTVDAVPVMFTIPEAMEVEEARWDGAVAMAVDACDWGDADSAVAAVPVAFANVGLGGECVTVGGRPVWPAAPESGV